MSLIKLRALEKKLLKLEGQLRSMLAEARKTWLLACQHEGISEEEALVKIDLETSPDNPFAITHHELLMEILRLSDRVSRLRREVEWMRGVKKNYEGKRTGKNT